jgi:hypothetical protein
MEPPEPVAPPKSPKLALRDLELPKKEMIHYDIFWGDQKKKGKMAPKRIELEPLKGIPVILLPFEGSGISSLPSPSRPFCSLLRAPCVPSVLLLRSSSLLP